MIGRSFERSNGQRRTRTSYMTIIAPRGWREDSSSSPQSARSRPGLHRSPAPAHPARPGRASARPRQSTMRARCPSELVESPHGVGCRARAADSGVERCFVRQLPTDRGGGRSTRSCMPAKRGRDWRRSTLEIGWGRGRHWADDRESDKAADCSILSSSQISK